MCIVKTKIKSVLVSAFFVSQSLVSVAHAAVAGHESGGRLAPMAVEVSFSALDGGIDDIRHAQFFELTFNDIRREKIRIFELQSVGREGDRRYCLEFFDFSEAFEFRTKIEDLIEGQNPQLTLVKPLLSCRPVKVDPRI
jgi:hypothetical protein